MLYGLLNGLPVMNLRASCGNTPTEKKLMESYLMVMCFMNMELISNEYCRKIFK